MQGKLAVDDAVVLHRVAAFPTAGHVHDMDDKRRTLDMAQELMTQPPAFVRALDQARNVRHDEVVFRAAHDAEIRHERGERIIGDLRLRGADARDRGGFAGRRHAHERGVGHKLHLKLHPLLCRRLAQLRKRRGTPDRRDKVNVPTAAHAAAPP